LKEANRNSGSRSTQTAQCLWFQLLILYVFCNKGKMAAYLGIPCYSIGDLTG